jgi:hypothetical protein
MGRPPKSPAEKQSGVVRAYLTPAEYRLLERQAQAAGLTLGGYLRKVWLDAKGD